MELIDPVEALRASFRPQEITTLFVGESAPHGGKTFFYDGDNDMVRYMERATDAALGGSGDFLGRFKAAGWYLDDLVLTPVNKMLKPERMRLCREAQGSLRDRIAAYRPRAIVSLLVSIRPIVEAAAAEAGSEARLFGVPFPGMGQQRRFHDEMAKIALFLPRHGVAVADWA